MGNFPVLIFASLVKMLAINKRICCNCYKSHLRRQLSTNRTRGRPDTLAVYDVEGKPIQDRCLKSLPANLAPRTRASHLQDDKYLGTIDTN